mgnify:CR=1 FL=1
MATHKLDASPETVHWGFFDAHLKPLITIDSGDTITMTSVSGAAFSVVHPDNERNLLLMWFSGSRRERDEDLYRCPALCRDYVAAACTRFR